MWWVTRPIHICGMNHSSCSHHTTHSHLLHLYSDRSIHMSDVNAMSDTTHSHMWHESFPWHDLFVTWIIRMYTWIISCILFHVYNSKFWSFPPISRISIFARFLHFFVFQAPSLPPQPDASVKRGHIQKLTIFVWFFRPEPPQVLSSGQVEHCSGNVFFYVLFAFSGECKTLGKLPTLGAPNNYSYEIRLIVGGAGGVRPMNESCLMSGRVMWYMLMSHVTCDTC